MTIQTLRIFSPDDSAAILAAAQSVLMGNNGYADIGNSPVVAEGLRAAGFVVIATTDLHGRPVNRGFTRAAQAALAQEPFGVPTYRHFVDRCLDELDYETLILNRQAAQGMYD